MLVHRLGIVLVAVTAVVMMASALTASLTVAIRAVLMIGAGILALISLSRICRPLSGKGCRTADQCDNCQNIPEFFSHNDLFHNIPPILKSTIVCFPDYMYSI